MANCAASNPHSALRTPRSVLVPALCGLICAAFCASAPAHPFPTEELGRFSELALHRDGVEVKYTISLTQLLAIEEIALMNANGDTKISDEEKQTYFTRLRETLRQGLKLEIDGAPVELKIARGIELKPPYYRILRYRCDFAPLSPGMHRIVFADENYPNMPGPVEITASADQQITLLKRADADLSKRYQELKAAGAPSGELQMRELEIVFRAPGAEGAASDEKASPDEAKNVEIKETPATDRPKEREAPEGFFGRLWTRSSEKMNQVAQKLFRGEIVGVKGISFALLVFMLIGAVHALTPGHGKTIVAAYLIGSKGRIRDAVFLGAIVTATHTSSVVLLGIVVHLLRNAFLPARLNPFIASASGLLIFIMGVCLLAGRIRGMSASGSDGHDHDHDHDLDHEHGHRHVHDGEVTLASLLSLGIAGGIVPCPDALAVLLTAVNLNHLLLGLALLLSFSFGLAVVLIGIGVLMVTGKMTLSKGAEESRLVRFYLPLASAAAIVLIGAAMTVVPLAGVVTVRISLPG